MNNENTQQQSESGQQPVMTGQGDYQRHYTPAIIEKWEQARFVALAGVVIAIYILIAGAIVMFR